MITFLALTDWGEGRVSVRLQNGGDGGADGDGDGVTGDGAEADDALQHPAALGHTTLLLLHDRQTTGLLQHDGGVSFLHVMFVSLTSVTAVISV